LRAEQVDGARMTTVAQAMQASGLPALDASVLMRHVLGWSAAQLVSRAQESMAPHAVESYQAAVARRAAGEPVAYIVGAREFFSLEFKVSPAVLIPRPETELLVEFALEHFAPDSACRVLDLGTGSGCIAISIARHRPHAHIVAVDSSVAALEVARDNARRHAASAIEFVHSDWFDALAGRQFDLIVANPPYIAAGDPHLELGDLRFEPAAALRGGDDGLACIRLIVASAPQYLAHGGWLAFEHGYDQSERAREILTAAGFVSILSRRDVAGIERLAGARSSLTHQDGPA
jgi:release factor glutamine methyltransferase